MPGDEEHARDKRNGGDDELVGTGGSGPGSTPEGPNGAGKTTTFYMIVGLLGANAGRVYLDQQELTRIPMYRRARAGIGYLSQEPSIFRRLTVEQNVMAILQTLDMTRAERQSRLDELLGELDLIEDEMALEAPFFI